MIKETLDNIGLGSTFFLLAVFAYVILGVFDPTSLRNTLSVLIRLITRIAPVLVLVFSVMFLTNLFFEAKWIVRFLGEGSGFRGWMVAIAGGIASAGPIYMWFPLLSDLKEKGMKDSLIAVFLYNRAVKIPLMPMIVYYFGWPFAVVLSIYMVLFSVVNGILVERLVGEGSKA